MKQKRANKKAPILLFLQFGYIGWRCLKDYIRLIPASGITAFMLNKKQLKTIAVINHEILGPHCIIKSKTILLCTINMATLTNLT